MTTTGVSQSQTRPTLVPDGHLITLDQVQSIQGARLGVLSPAPPKWRRFRRVKAGSDDSVRFGPTSVRTTSTRGICAPVNQVITCPPVQPADVDRDGAETVASGVAEGLRRAPLIVTEQAPWNAPGFRGNQFPKTARVILSTFGATNTRTVQLQRAMAGYLGISVAVIATAVPVANTPVSVISFACPDNYKGEEIVVSCQDHQILYLAQWTITRNGRVESGPFFLYGGRAKVNVQAKRDDTISVNVIVPTGDSFAVPCEVAVNGYIYPSINSTDGTYSKVLRSSPQWSREEGLAS